MTTAHRPTWKPAYGLSDQVNKGYIPTRSYSARDLPSYLSLKDRKQGQGSINELKQKDFKAELLARQAEVKRKRNGGLEITQESNGKLLISEDVDVIGNFETGRKRIKRPDDEKEDLLDLGDNPFPEDADSEQFVREVSEQGQKRSGQDSASGSEDEDEELLREYEKIKQQREKEELHRVIIDQFKKQEKHKQSMANRQAELLKGNPLIDSSYSLSKRWYEDTVFRHQAKKVEEKKSFINDYVRSDFHRKFMNRYVCR